MSPVVLVISWLIGMASWDFHGGFSTQYIKCRMNLSMEAAHAVPSNRRCRTSFSPVCIILIIYTVIEQQIALMAIAEPQFS